jgi:general secretion pathway protein B
MIAARMLPWGFVDASSGRRLLRPRQEVATRLAGDLAEFLSASRRDPAGLSQISVCGAMPDLRSMTAQLVERLDVEVEPLDSMFGINPRLRDQQFSERVAEMRLAWAAAADERPSLDLFRARRAGLGRRYRSRVAIAAGVVAGLGLGWLVQQRLGPVTARPRPTFTPARPAPPPLAAAQPPVEAPAAIAPVGDSIPAPGLPTAAEPAAALPQDEPARREPELDPIDVPRRPEPTPAPRPTRPAETPLAFDANLGTILFGLERRLAIVDGRIVGEGDEVRGARVVEISQNAVLLRDAQGRLRRLTGGSR